MPDYLARAKRLREMNRHEDAIPVLMDALRESPDSAPVMVQMSLVFLNLGKNQESLEWAEKAVAADPLLEHPHRLRAHNLFRLKRKKEGLAAARHAVSLAPESAFTLQMLANLYIETHAWKEAEEIAKKGVQLLPEDADSHRILASALVGQRRWDEAEQAARYSVQLDPQDPLVYVILADVLWGQKRYTESLQMCREAVLLDLNDSVPLNVMSDKVGSYLMPVEKVMPPFIGMCLLSLFCWICNYALGFWALWATLWSVVVLIIGGVYVSHPGAWILGRMRKRFEEIPPEVRRHVWLSRGFEWGGKLGDALLLTAGLTVIVMLVWTFRPIFSPTIPNLQHAAPYILVAYWIVFIWLARRLAWVDRQLRVLKPVEPEPSSPEPPVLTPPSYVSAYDLQDDVPRQMDYDLDE